MTREATASSILPNAVASLIGRKLGLILRAIAMLQAAAYLGEAGWGLFGFLVSVFEVFRVLTSLGLDTAALRSVSIHPLQSDPIIRAVLWVKTAFVVLAIGAVASFGSVIPSWMAHRSLLLVLALGLIPQAYTATLTVRFQAAHVMARLIPVQVAVGGLYLLGVQFLVRGNAAVAGFLIFGVAMDYVTLGLTWLAGRRAARRQAAATEPPTAEPVSPASPGRWSVARLILAGLPLGVVEFMVIAYSRLGVLFLERYGGVVAVGDYFAAFKVAEPLVIIGGAVAMSALPVLSRLAGEGQLERLRAVFVRYSLGSALLSSGLATIVSLLASPILRLIKPEFAAGAGALSALIWAAGFMLQNQLSSAVLFAFGKFSWVAGCAVFNLVVYVILGSNLVHSHGPTGAGLATLGTEGLNTLIQLILVRRVLRGAASGRLTASYA